MRRGLYRIRNMLRRWFNGRTRPRPAAPAVANQEGKHTAFQPAMAIYKKGDFIDQEHEVCDVLGVGGFGVVYLVHAGVYEGPEQSALSSRPWLLALKTLRDEYLENEQTRERFRREANVWVDLERHPYVVRAHYVREIAGRLYIAMEYIAPDSDGLNSLRGHLERRPPDLAQSLRWGIQFCHGMEYAYAMGVRCHRDIKPDNILITSDHILKITDFGIAGILVAAVEEPGVGLVVQNGRIGSSQLTMEGGGFGTPTHMPPEQFVDPAMCDERSDIYSFGIVLYQMRTGGKCPFPPPLPRGDSKEEAGNFWRAMRALHTDAPVPILNSRLFPVIERCLQKEPRNRYRSFQELRSELEPMLKRLTAEIIAAPELKDHEAWEWNNKAASLKQLGRYEEAILCCEKALDIDPQCADFSVQQRPYPTYVGATRRSSRLLLDSSGDRSAICRCLVFQGQSVGFAGSLRRSRRLLLEGLGDRSARRRCLVHQGLHTACTGPIRGGYRLLLESFRDRSARRAELSRSSLRMPPHGSTRAML